ncbi:regulator of rDNA transcription 14 [[Candida] jaroonii]|uniref:Regulator of rDNA transcription 14 n=1 Tax=[Candida] jaroonii TaxID=467808 RepID=A0ACA9Y7G2_9ASCO|nr:regulator of rDNA transcription 14 [[Candida] jaroonii]
MFSSNLSKSKSENLLRKLTGDLTKASDKKKSSTEALLGELNKKVTKKKKNKIINKKAITEAKDLKRINYEIIKSKPKDQLDDHHKKYLKKLVRKNKRLLINDEEDLEDIQAEILNFEKKAPKKDKSFKEHKFPGLTPGLAPVGYESDDEDDE